METRGNFKKYLVFSIGFHVIVLVLLVLFGEAPPIREEPTTQVTMLRLTRSAGSTSSALLKKTGTPGESTAPPTPAKPPEKPPEKAPDKPVVKAPEPQVKPAPAKPPVRPPEKTVTVPAPKKPVAKPASTPTGPAPEKPAAPAAPTQTSPDDEKIAQALAGVKTELDEREAQSQVAAASAEKPGAGSAPGAPGGAEGSPFGSPGGSIAATDPALARYQSQVRSKIIREWVRTASGAEGEVLRARVVVRINASGGVVSSSLSKRSGNASFDNSALRAVERASPLPAPPQMVLAEALQEGFVIDFSSRMLK